MTYPIIGVDPGAKGGVAVLIDGKFVAVTDLPHLTKEVDIDALDDWVWEHTQRDMGVGVVALERQQMIGKTIGSSQAFAMGVGYGMLLGWARGRGSVLFTPPPAAWKRALGLSTDKDASRALARSLYPESTPHLLRVKDDGRAEAILLAHWAYLKKGKR